MERAVKLGIVLATRADLATARDLALAARRADHDVAMFAMDAGCAALAEHPEIALALLDADCEIAACANSSVGLAIPPGIVVGSQDDHAKVVATADRVVALT
jgi:hypothetical protein